MKKRKLLSNLNFEDASVVSEFSVLKPNLGNVRPICALSKLPTSTLGVALNLEDNKLLNVFGEFLSEEAWNEKEKYPQIRELTHFLPVYHSNDLSKALVKNFLRPFRALLAEHSQLQDTLERNEQTSSNGVMVLLIYACIFLKLVYYFLKTEDSSLEVSLKRKQLFEYTKAYLENLTKLWKTARSYLISLFSSFICDIHQRDEIFLTFNSRSKENGTETEFLFLILSFPLGASFLKETFDMILCHFHNQFFVQEVKAYTALNADLDLEKGRFKSQSELNDLSRQKLLFHYFVKKLRIILFITSIASAQSAGYGVLKKINEISNWVEYCRVLLKLRGVSKYWLRKLLQDVVFMTDDILKEDAVIIQFRVHVVVSALCKYHTPRDTTSEDLMAISQGSEYAEKIKFLLPESKVILLKTRLSALDDNLEEFKSQYERIDEQKNKLLATNKQITLENANLKQNVLDLQDQIKKLEQLLKLERELHLVKNAKSSSKSQNNEIVEEAYLDKKGNFHQRTKRRSSLEKALNFFRCLLPL